METTAEDIAGMNEPNPAPTITLRIPGDWSGPESLLEQLPDGFRLTPEALFLPDGTRIDFTPMPPDDQFAQVFQSSCARPPREEEQTVVAGYSVNVGLSGPGGSLQAARTMMQAAAAIVRAGGAGVFIDNSGKAHGGADWIEMTEDGGTDALSFTWVSVIRGRQDVYTVGLHVLGLPDLVMRPADMDEQGATIVEIMCYLCDSGRAMDVGHVIADESGPRFQVVERLSDDFAPESPAHNPFGRLKIVSNQSLAEGN